MDAAKELTGTCLQRVPRWWAGKDPTASAKTSRERRPHQTVCWWSCRETKAHLARLADCWLPRWNFAHQATRLVVALH
ncbi:hypothetical protein DGM85_01875 [Xanthomonas phaseoli pv. phaseoli]|nr:hypothetical protein DGM93_01720 [Xanthomonas phaseoli pv. phaseoli]QWN27468.1 hypothetical protein DGM85_01875 [Xanthomonas phaseoli pv. phaseoli]QWN31616.1 hypothetical protein DGM81_01725 [Xanthomonas phaseoli pv. phaseoli]